MQLYVIRRPSAWASLAELEIAGAKSARIGNEEMPDKVRWIRSYVVNEADGRVGTFCIYQAKDGAPSASTPAASACRARSSIQSRPPSSSAPTRSRWRPRRPM